MGRIKNVTFRSVLGVPSGCRFADKPGRAPMVLELQRANAYWSSDGVGDGKWRSIGETESTTGAVGALPFLMGGAVKLANSKRRTLPTMLNPEDIDVNPFCAVFSLDRRYDSYWVDPRRVDDFQVIA